MPPRQPGVLDLPVVGEKRARVAGLRVKLCASRPWPITRGDHREPVRRAPANQEVYLPFCVLTLDGFHLPEIGVDRTMSRRIRDFVEGAWIQAKPLLHLRKATVLRPDGSFFPCTGQPERRELARAERHGTDAFEPPVLQDVMANLRAPESRSGAAYFVFKEGVGATNGSLDGCVFENLIFFVEKQYRFGVRSLRLPNPVVHFLPVRGAPRIRSEGQDQVRGRRQF